MNAWAIEHLKISEFMFKDGDTVIAGTNKSNSKLLEAGVVSGYYKKGGYISDVYIKGYETRGSFTIHSFQGRTVESGTIWICINDLFEYAMLYTAVSRAVNYSQLKFFII
jgi:ATP-dependent exoDNAse (exonuclease V) alpha subunit